LYNPFRIVNRINIIIHSLVIDSQDLFVSFLPVIMKSVGWTIITMNPYNTHKYIFNTLDMFVSPTLPCFLSRHVISDLMFPSTHNIITLSSFHSSLLDISSRSFSSTLINRYQKRIIHILRYYWVTVSYKLASIFLTTGSSLYNRLLLLIQSYPRYNII